MFWIRGTSWAILCFYISARKPNTPVGDFVVTIVTTVWQESCKFLQKHGTGAVVVTTNTFRCATGFRFKRSEPTCMNGTSVKNTLPFNQPLRTFAVADVQRK